MANLVMRAGEPKFASNMERVTTRDMFGKASVRMHKNSKDISKSKILYKRRHVMKSPQIRVVARRYSRHLR